VKAQSNVHHSECVPGLVSGSERIHIEGLEDENRRLRAVMQHAMNALEADKPGEAWTALKVTLRESGGTCDRLLVGQGGDTWDPLCTLPAGHKGRCEP
jgi:hypothetical protein